VHALSNRRELRISNRRCNRAVRDVRAAAARRPLRVWLFALTFGIRFRGRSTGYVGLSVLLRTMLCVLLDWLLGILADSRGLRRHSFVHRHRTIHQRLQWTGEQPEHGKCGRQHPK